MCKHKQFSIVAFEAVSIAQCDLCGLLLPDVDVGDEVAPTLAVDVQALDFAYGIAFAGVRREWERLDGLSPVALSALVRKTWGVME